MPVEAIVKRRGRRPLIPRHVPPEELAARYDRYFEAMPAQNRALIHAAQQLRYQVLCEERQLLRPENYPDGLESDSFDAHAMHAVLRYREDQSLIGALRVIMPHDGVILPAFGHCPELLEEIGMPQTAELSRFVISREFRRRWNDGYYGEVSDISVGGHSQRHIPHMTLGLLRLALEFAAQRDITHVAALAEPAMLRMMAGLGIHFAPVGGLVECHGLRQSCYAKIATLLHRMQKEKPEIWHYVTGGGRLG